MEVVTFNYITIVMKPKCVFLSLSRVQKNLENVQK